MNEPDTKPFSELSADKLADLLAHHGKLMNGIQPHNLSAGYAETENGVVNGLVFCSRDPRLVRAMFHVVKTVMENFVGSVQTVVKATTEETNNGNQS